MTPDAMIKEGIRLYKAGKKAEARAIWEKVTEIDQLNEQAWLWLSAVVEGVDDQRTCLENVLYINPDNVNAKKGLEMLEAKAAKEKPTPPPPAPEPEPVRQAFVPPTPTSSASSVYTPEEPEPEVYDNWIGSLNLGNKNDDSSAATTAPFTVPAGFDDDSFADDNFDDFSFEDEDDAPPSKPEWQGNDLRAALMDDDDIDFDEDPFDSDPFVDDPFADENEPNLRSGPFSAAALDDDDDDEVVDASALRGIQSPPAPIPMPAARRTSSPPPAAAPSKQQSFANTNASRYFAGDDVKPMDEPDPSEYFAAIPDEIKATRLPGTDERRPRLVMIGLVLLVLLNLGAVGLLVFQLVG